MSDQFHPLEKLVDHPLAENEQAEKINIAITLKKEILNPFHSLQGKLRSLTSKRNAEGIDYVAAGLAAELMGKLTYIEALPSLDNTANLTPKGYIFLAFIQDVHARII